MGQRETEFKFLLNTESLETLLGHLGEPLRERRFVNRYYTVEEHCGRKDWVLRLRQEEGVGELTLKVGREMEPGVFDSTEFSAAVKVTDLASWEETEPLRVLRREISASALLLQGEAFNHRRVFRAPIEVGARWEVDSTLLPNGVSFHELEVEVDFSTSEDLAKLAEKLRGWLRESGVVYEMSDKTKYARFLQAISSET